MKQTRNHSSITTHDTIETLLAHWLSQRQTLQHHIDLLENALSDWSPTRWHEPACPLPHQLKRVCQLLVDYLSAGHFEVYRQLLHKHGSKPIPAPLATLLRPAERLLAFNDVFGDKPAVAQVAVLPARLAELQLILDDHFLREDALVDFSLATDKKSS